MNIALVFIGGGIGAGLRYLVSQQMTANEFPWGTVSVNLLGCLLIGIIGFQVMQENPKLWAFAGVGFLGGFTTFSSFGLDLLRLFQEGQVKSAIVYFLISNVIGVLLVYIGYKLGNVFLK